MNYIIRDIRTLTRFVCVRGTYRIPPPHSRKPDVFVIGNYYKDDICI